MTGCRSRLTARRRSWTPSSDQECTRRGSACAFCQHGPWWAPERKHRTSLVCANQPHKSVPRRKIGCCQGLTCVLLGIAGALVENRQIPVQLPKGRGQGMQSNWFSWSLCAGPKRLYVDDQDYVFLQADWVGPNHEICSFAWTPMYVKETGKTSKSVKKRQ